MMNTILQMLFTLTAAGSAVVACILLLRTVSANAFPAKWRYGMSKMAVGFYLVPIALGIQWISPLFTFNATATAPTANELSSTVQHALPGPYSAVHPKLLVPELTLSATAAVVLIFLWALGAIAFAAWQMYCYRRFLMKLEPTRTIAPESSEAAKQLAFVREALGVKSSVRLAYSPIVRSPVLVGLWRPTIYLPIENTVNLDMVIRHELVHLKRKDLWIKAFTLGASALHWFNPLVHILRKDIHLWSELSCDEEVVQEMSHTQRKRYGETILSVMAGSRNLPVQFCASLSGDGKQLKRRLMMMLNVKKPKKKTVYLTITALFLVGAISTSAAAWASGNSPKVVGNEESRPEAKPSEAAPKAAPSEAVAGNEGNQVVTYPKEAAPAPREVVVENEGNHVVTLPKEAAPMAVIVENRGSDVVAAPIEAAPREGVVEKAGNQVVTYPTEAAPAEAGVQNEGSQVVAPPKEAAPSEAVVSEGNQVVAPSTEARPAKEGYKLQPNEAPREIPSR
ncbi:M56 family metallopeptidase [Paenibacillus sp. FSL W8-0919]|uniref:M56 family metallopeptidase n=2 Tax=Paenibacillus TaxID=44249 RepID=UPI002AA55B1C